MKSILVKLWQAVRRPGPGAPSQNPLITEVLDAAQDSLPLPPDDLRILVAGTPNIPWFMNGGYLSCQSILDALARHQIQLENGFRVLDFGCGCGRTLRHWARVPHISLYGSDYNPLLVDWCNEHLPFVSGSVNALEPPLPHASESFDLVYALSVFTHLPEALQLPWMAEMARVIKPNGYLLLTLHGESYMPDIPPEYRERFESGRLVVVHEDLAGENLCGAFHPPAYVSGEFTGKSFEVIDFVPEGAKGNPHQDLYLLKRRA
jgi:SAM-dependent methyltransferase